MHRTTTVHVYPDDHYEELTFVSNKDGIFDDKSIGFISAIDLEGDECHLPNVKASAVVKFFTDFLEIEDVLREKDNGGRATEETMKNLRKIHTKISKWIKQEEEEDK